MPLRALIGIMSFLSTLVACDLIKWSEASLSSSVCTSTFVVISSVHSSIVVVELHTRVLLLLPQFSRHFVAGYCFVPCLTAIMAHNVGLLRLLRWVLDGQVKLGMHKFALGSIRTKSAQVVDAHDTSSVSVAADGAVPTEAAVIPGTILNFRFGIYVQKRALLVTARVEARIEVTLRHFRHVELVEKLALITFLAKTSKPVLTDHCSVTLNMPERACRCFATVSLHVKAAHGRSRLVHTREWQRQSAELLLEGHLQFEHNISHLGYYFLHRKGTRCLTVAMNTSYHLECKVKE